PLTTSWSPPPGRLIRTLDDATCLKRPGISPLVIRRQSQLLSTMSRYSRPPNTSLFVRTWPMPLGRRICGVSLVGMAQ
ncbi:unnamed protein product, partial [Staurois parvus]